MSADIFAKQFFNLMIFRAACTTGSITRAASALGITQPAATRGISRLETALGCRLTERNVGGVQPTEFGKSILGQLDVASHAIGVASRELSALRRKREGSVVCGAAPVNMAFVGEAASRFHQHYPLHPLHLIEGSTPSLIGRLLAAEIDMAVGSHFEDIQHDALVIEPLLDEQIGIFVRRGHMLAGASRLCLADILKQGCWVLPDTNTQLHGLIHRKLADLALPLPARLIESHSTIAVRWLVQHSDCLAISTSLVHAADLRSGDVVMLPVDWDIPPTQHVLYRRHRSQMSRFALAFADAIKDAATRFQSDISSAQP